MHEYILFMFKSRVSSVKVRESKWARFAMLTTDSICVGCNKKRPLTIISSSVETSLLNMSLYNIPTICTATEWRIIFKTLWTNRPLIRKISARRYPARKDITVMGRYDLCEFGLLIGLPQ
jgi:hypothetical protein